MRIDFAYLSPVSVLDVVDAEVIAEKFYEIFAPQMIKLFAESCEKRLVVCPMTLLPNLTAIVLLNATSYCAKCGQTLEQIASKKHAHILTEQITLHIL